MSIYLHNKKIVLGITGCIAAYKACELIRLLQKAGAKVKVLATSAALEFVTPLTLTTLSKHRLYHEMFDQTMKVDIEHIDLARWADLILIAPATANTIAKLNYGLADNLLTSVCLAAKVPLAIAPAMNEAMWNHSATQENIKSLQKKGANIFEPQSGEQACGEFGTGRMIEPQELVKLVNTLLLPPKLKDRKVVITAGRTEEPIDAVRFISNYSSGKMGYALAKAAYALGAEVTLISGPSPLSPPHGIDFFTVKTAQKMHDIAIEKAKVCDLFISAAAIADYRPKRVSKEKIKKNYDELELRLIKNPDLLMAVTALTSPPFTVGFAAETQSLLEHASKKLVSKKLDMIAANYVGEGKGFGQEDNELILLKKSGGQHHLPLQSKLSLAYELLGVIADALPSNSS